MQHSTKCSPFCLACCAYLSISVHVANTLSHLPSSTISSSRSLYPDVYDDDFVEFDSMINIRPRQHNASRSVENIDIQNKIGHVRAR